MARQVGKIYLIREFAKTVFDDYVFLDLGRQVHCACRLVTLD